MVLIKVTNGSFVVSMNTDREDRLWLETLKSIFPDARNLVYTSNKSETVALSVRNEKIFNEDGWDPNILYLVYNGLQKTTSVDQGVIISTPPPTISKVATKVFNECSNRVYRVYGEICSNVTTTNDQQKQSVSQQIGSGVQYREKRILTSAHLKFFLGNEYDIWNNGITLKATCIYINKSLDRSIRNHAA